MSDGIEKEKAIISDGLSTGSRSNQKVRPALVVL
jgi:hypothetical protein